MAQFFPETPKPQPTTGSGFFGNGSSAGDAFSVSDWVDTGIDVRAGETIKFSAAGTITYQNGGATGPDGTKKIWMDLLKTFPLNDAGRGALIGRIGEGRTVRPFLIGTQRESRAPVAGRLWLGINQPQNERGSGAFEVSVDISGTAAPKVNVDVSRLPQLTQSQLDSIPARVVDADGTEGDRVNFIIIGSEQKVVGALRSAGWITVNRTNKDAVLGALMSVLNKQGYTELPMSELLMFERVQDYGFAMGDPIQVIAARHHFRLWRAPFTIGGEQVWVGAGTHDVGFDKDQRNNGITHKIDPNTDLEREFITESLVTTGQVAHTSFMTRKDPVTRAKTAHGQEYYSDGRTAIIIMHPDEHNQSQSFTSLFCSVLKDKNPDGGDWGQCSEWMTSADTPAKKSSLGNIPPQYRILIVPGLMNTCFKGAPPYKEGQEYLKSTYGLTVEMLTIPNNSTEDNARMIGEYLRAKMKDDRRKYIVIGYSKGTPDFQVALVQEQGVKEATAAFVSIGGASGGSAVADTVPDMAEKWIQQYSLPGCEGNLSEGFRSLGTRVRKAFLSSNPHPVVPTYSLATISDAGNSSKMLAQTKMILDSVSKKNDSQLTEEDQIIPESIYLGTARADHFAIALPFETSQEAIRTQADKNHYPRTALLESVIRFVINDLKK